MRPAPRRRGAFRRRSRMLALLLSPLALAAALVALPASPAAAAVTWDLPNDAFVGQNVITLSGSKDPASTLRVEWVDTGGIVCEVSAGSDVFDCPPLSVPNGRLTFRAIETIDDVSGEPSSLTVRVLGPPTVSAPSGRIVTAGRVIGQGQPGAQVQVQTIGPNGTVTHACPAALPDGFWSCALSSDNAPSGEYTVRARQGVPAPGTEFSVFSGGVPMTLDRTAPAAPEVTAPSPGTVLDEPRAVVTGTAEPGASIQVFANGEQRCTTTATAGGAWECPVVFAGAGEWDLQALQRDAAGNFSAPTARLPVIVAGDDPSPSPAPGTPAPGTPAPAPQPGETTQPPPANPGEPGEPGDGDPTPSPEPTPDDSDEGAAPTPGPDDGALRPDPTRPGSPSSDPLTSNWGTPTTFGASLPTAAEVLERGGWLIGLAIGLGYLLLVAAPMRLATRAVLPRLAPAGFRLTGRNRAVTADDDSPLLPGWLVAVGVLGGATLVAALSGGIDLEVRYLRLMAAIGAALLVLNLLAVVIPARIAGRATSAVVTERLLPSMLIAATVTALLSRLWELQPPILVGVLVATTIVGIVPRAARAGVAIAQTTGVAVVALAGWALHDVLSPAVGFWANLAAEGAAALALGGFGSIVLLLLPVGPFPGRTLYAISRVGWAIVTVLTAAVGSAVAVSGPSFPVVPLAFAAGAFGAVCLALFAWTRWVEPSLR